MVYEPARTTGNVVDFTCSPSEHMYWITDAGELWTAAGDGEAMPLVTRSEVMTNTPRGATQDIGTVIRFYVSPDNTYIAYETLEKYTGCCGNISDIPVTRLRIMRSDGTDRVVMAKPSTVNRELVFFDGWFPDSSKILFHFSAPDESTQGSPFFEVGVDGKNPSPYTGINFAESGDTMTVAGAHPIFSPQARKMAYIEGGIVGEGKIWLAKTDGTEKILLLDDERFNTADITWSNDGSLLVVNGTHMFVVFTADGNIVFQKQVQKQEEMKNLVSQDNTYIVGLNK